MPESQGIAEELLSLLLQKEKAENAAKALNREVAKKSEFLAAKMDEEKCDGVSIRGIDFKPELKRTFSLSLGDEAKRDRLKWDEIPEWFGWLKEISEEGLIRTKESVPWNTREKFLKEWVDEGKVLPEFIAGKYYDTVKYNKSAVKRLYESQTNGD